MTGNECKQWRERLGIKQTRLAWDVGVDATLVSRWEAGVYRLRPAVIESIRVYLAQRLVEAKAELATMELPGIEQVAR